MAKDREVRPVLGRRDAEPVNAADLDALDRPERAERYLRMMKPFVDADLLNARAEQVRRLRSGKWNGQIDSKWDRWYRPEHWTDEGEFIGPDDWFDKAHPEGE